MKELFKKIKSKFNNFYNAYIKKFMNKILPKGILTEDKSLLVIKRLIIFALFLFVLQGIIVSVVVFIVVKAGGESFVLPDVKGVEAFEAFNILAKEDMNLNIQSHYFKDYPLGTIVSQEPKGGMRVKRGRTVYLVVNVPEQALVKMPDLTGKSYDDAVSIISNEIISKIPSVTILPKLNDNNSAYDNNVVLSQVPNANEVIGINTEIILTVNNKTE